MKRIFVALAVFMGCSGAAWCTDPSATQFLSNTLWDANGKPVSLEGLKGRKVLINFYASWCGGCIEEIKDLNRIKTDTAGKMDVIGISLDNDTGVVRSFASRTGMNYFSLVSGGLGASMMNSLGNDKKAVPYTVMIEKSGNISFTKLGLLKKEDLETIKGKVAEQ
jgi:peroxiredoxin